MAISLKYSHQPLEQPRVGIIVRFRNPDVFSLCQAHALVPLLEWAAGIYAVKLESYSGIARVVLENRSAFVGRAVVQQDQLEILIGLPQHALDPRLEEARVIVIRDDDANCRHRLVSKTVLSSESQLLLDKWAVPLSTFGAVSAHTGLRTHTEIFRQIKFAQRPRSVVRR